MNVVGISRASGNVHAITTLLPVCVAVTIAIVSSLGDRNGSST